MTIRTLLSACIAAVIVAGCGGNGSTTGSLPDSSSTYIMNGGVKTVGTSTAALNTITYKGQGLTSDGSGGYVLETELCAVADGAESDKPYLLWNLTGTKATTASIAGPWGTAPMVKEGEGVGGVFKYVSDWYDLGTLPSYPVIATYDGEKMKPQLVISHGCPPKKKGAWCSPGFWRNAEDGAWNLIGQSKDELFNDTVHAYFYGATLTDNPTLGTVLSTNGGTYKGAGVTGASGCAMNAFNAVAAFLTSNLEGYEFSCTLMQADDDSTDADDPCPIDHHGNWK